jgi:hypothetical protein
VRARLEEDRRSLLHRIEQFNARVSATSEAGLTSLLIGNAGQGSAVASQDGSSFQHPIATMQAQHSTDSAAKSASPTTKAPPYAAFVTADGATCDPPDPEEKYRMRPREEVEKENPELAALLKKHANENREIMLTLANGIMICKNATICWWNGGCSAEWQQCKHRLASTSSNPTAAVQPGNIMQANSVMQLLLDPAQEGTSLSHF